MRNGVMIISPWQPFGYGLFLWASFYITLLDYNKTKCNIKSGQNYLQGNLWPEKERVAQKLGLS